MRVTALLCDGADVVNGKLYILGGGWSIVQAESPQTHVIAMKLDVPWGESNLRHRLAAALITQDGQPVSLGDGTVVPRASLEFEVGRPPGMAHGTPLDIPIKLSLGTFNLPAGRYAWEISVDGQPVTGGHLAFSAVGP